MILLLVLAIAAEVFLLAALAIERATRGSRDDDRRQSGKGF